MSCRNAKEAESHADNVCCAAEKASKQEEAHTQEASEQRTPICNDMKPHHIIHDADTYSETDPLRKYFGCCPYTLHFGIPADGMHRTPYLSTTLTRGTGKIRTVQMNIDPKTPPYTPPVISLQKLVVLHPLLPQEHSCHVQQITIYQVHSSMFRPRFP